MLLERMFDKPGVPARARSKGIVISCSTSSEASPGAGVMTCAVTSPMSGYASTDIFVQE